MTYHCENQDRAGPSSLGVSPADKFYLVRQLISPRHLCTIDQNRDDRNRPPKSGRNFYPHEVIRVIKLSVEPERANDGKKNFGLLDLAVKVVDEVDTKRNVVDVLEDVLVAKFMREAIVNPPNNCGAVITSIA